MGGGIKGRRGGDKLRGWNGVLSHKKLEINYPSSEKSVFKKMIKVRKIK